MIGSMRSSRSFGNSTTRPQRSQIRCSCCCLRRHRLVALEALAEVVRPDQAALDQHIERAVDGGGADPLAPLLEHAPDAVDRKVIVGEEDDLGDEIALAGDRLVMVAEVPAEALEEGRALCL